MSVYMVAGLLMAATTLAVSPHNDRWVAATDGMRVWVTENAGQSWRQIARESPAPDTGSSHGDPPIAVRSLAFLGAELLWSTPTGLRAWTPGDGVPKMRSTRAFHALCVWETTLFAAQEGHIYRSDDGGRSFAVGVRAPDAPVLSLAVTDARILAATASGTFLYDGVTWRKASGPAHVAASSDGSLWRAGWLGIERSTQVHGWRLVHAGRFSAVAVGPGRIWAATAKRVLPIEKQLPVADREHASQRALLAEKVRRAFVLSRRARRAAWLPAVHVNTHARFATSRGDSSSRQRESTFFVSLSWAIDDTTGSQTALAASQAAMSIRRLIHKTGAKQ